MGVLRSALVLLLVGCVSRLVVPDLDRFSEPVWPSPPDMPRVAFVGSIETPAGGFSRPVDVACGPGRTLAVADVGAGTVNLLDLDRRRAWRTQTAGGEPLASPVGVAFGPAGLYVVDSERRAVYLAAGRRLGFVQVVPDTVFVRPTDAIATPAGDLLVVDSGAHAVLRGSADSASLERIAGPLRGDDGGLNYPVRAVVAADGSVLVADAMNAAVQRVGGRAPVFVAGGHGQAGTAMVQPKGIAVDDLGRIHVVDAGMQHVQVYDVHGVLVGRYGRPGVGPGELGLPGGLCIDEDSRVYVADSVNHRIQVFQLLAPAEDAP